MLFTQIGSRVLWTLRAEVTTLPKKKGQGGKKRQFWVYTKTIGNVLGVDQEQNRPNKMNCVGKS